jgi:hypothetical protein
MSLLPLSTYSSPATPLYATQAQLSSIVNSISSINIVSSNGSGIVVSEPTLNNFDVSCSFSNAGGISFLTYPGSPTIGFSNAGVTQLTAGSGIGVSAGTGSVTVSNTGVLSVSAGMGISVGGTATAPIVNNSISAGVNVVTDQFNSNPITAVTPAGGFPTTIVTYGSLVPGKTYLFCLNVALSSSTTDDSKTCSIGIKFASIPEVYGVITIPNNTSGFLQNATCALTIPAGETSFNVQVSGFNYTTETATGSINNSVIIPLN